MVCDTHHSGGLRRLREGPVCSCTAGQRCEVPLGQRLHLAISFTFFSLFFLYSFSDATDSGSSSATKWVNNVIVCSTRARLNTSTSLKMTFLFDSH